MPVPHQRARASIELTRTFLPLTLNFSCSFKKTFTLVDVHRCKPRRTRRPSSVL